MIQKSEPVSPRQAKQRAAARTLHRAAWAASSPEHRNRRRHGARLPIIARLTEFLSLFPPRRDAPAPLHATERKPSAGTDDEAGHAYLNQMGAGPRGAVGGEVGETSAEEHLRAERLGRGDLHLSGREQRRQGAASVRRRGVGGGRCHESTDLDGPGVRRLNRIEPRCCGCALRRSRGGHGPSGLRLIEERGGGMRRARCNGLWRRCRWRRAWLIRIVGGIRITARGQRV